MKQTMALLLAVGLLLTGCGGGASQAPAEPQALTSGDGHHSLTIPGGWKDEGDSLNPNAVLAASNRSEEQYLIILPDNRENLAVIYPDFDLSGYSAYIVETMSKRMGEPQVGEPQVLEVGGKPAVLTEFSGIIKNTRITYWVYCVELEGIYAQLIGWTSSDRAEGCREEMGEILSSYIYRDEVPPEEVESSQAPPVEKMDL